MEFAAFDEKDWEAFRYVCGEMTAEERHAFELCLASDESLCDAVERAVELNAAIGSAAATAGVVRPTVRSAERNTIGRRRTAWGLALAASLLAAAYLGRTVWQGRDQGEVAGPVAGATSSGAPARTEAGMSLVWSDLRQQESAEDVAAPWTGSESVAELPATPTGMGDPADALPPQWLLTAVAGASNAKETP